ncbi:MAG: 2-oxo-4-hydroxy-4-carboxy-5-ureidoimidazoline decarboxylase [Chromatiales bacterium]|nr:2-oxo-4-hydroxy-4-carboxy-5-ureidoimidazoline decarboxylase [Chromatiales bacterium]
MLTLSYLNGLAKGSFVDTLADVFEHSAWVGEAVYGARPFTRVTHLHEAMVEAMRAAPRPRQLALIRAHPRLAGQAALAGNLSAHSNAEQASAGLTACTAAELATLEHLNLAYEGRFDFPFILAVRGRNKAEIMRLFTKRCARSPEDEFEEALRQIALISGLRLDALFGHDDE